MMKLFFAATAAYACGLASAAAAIVLAPHRAVYEMTASSIESKSGISSASGLLAYEITGNSCSGWSTTYRIATRYLRNEGGEQLNDTVVTSWEAGDATEFQLEQRQSNDGQESARTNVSAKKPPGSAGKGELTRPTERSFEIPREALFPVAYQIHLLQAAFDGHDRDASVIYEGSDEDKSQSVVSVVGKPIAENTPVAGIDEKAAAELAKSPAWPMSSSYYPLQANAADVPDYQSSYIMHANGISTDLLFDYGTYKLKGRLKSLEFLPTEKCP